MLVYVEDGREVPCTHCVCDAFYDPLCPVQTHRHKAVGDNVRPHAKRWANQGRYNKARTFALLGTLGRVET